MGTSQFAQPIALGRILHSAWNEGRRVLGDAIAFGPPNVQ
jgi:hypothetical protein